MHRTAWLFGLASIAAIATSTRTAHALDVEVAAKAGGATNPYSGGGVSPLGFGLGGRAGVVLLEHLYGGVNEESRIPACHGVADGRQVVIERLHSRVNGLPES
jgi:hypothetical protein